MTKTRYNDGHDKDRKIIWVDSATREKLKAKATKLGLSLKDYLAQVAQK